MSSANVKPSLPSPPMSTPSKRARKPRRYTSVSAMLRDMMGRTKAEKVIDGMHALTVSQNVELGQALMALYKGCLFKSPSSVRPPTAQQVQAAARVLKRQGWL